MYFKWSRTERVSKQLLKTKIYIMCVPIILCKYISSIQTPQGFECNENKNKLSMLPRSFLCHISLFKSHIQSFHTVQFYCETFVYPFVSRDLQEVIDFVFRIRGTLSFMCFPLILWKSKEKGDAVFACLMVFYCNLSLNK